MKKYSWGLCPSSWFDAISDEFFKNFESPLNSSLFKTSGYPVDVLIEDKDGRQVDVIQVAIAGVSRDRVKVSVKEDGGDSQLTISVSGKEAKTDSNVVAKNISGKAWSVTYALPFHDVTNVTSSLVDGLLRVDVPRKALPEPQVREVAIN